LRELPLIEHLGELRKRLLSIITAIVLLFILGIAISNSFINKIQDDLVISGITITAITPLEYFYTQIKIGLVIALVICFPFILFHVLAFVKPGLQKRERIAILYILPSILLLFLVGILFCYLVFLPIAIKFFSGLALQGNVVNLWTIDRFFNFILVSCLAFGLVFQLPLLLLVLSKLNLISIDFLRKQRKYVYVLLFIIAAIITPPDAFTLVLAVVPLIALYELSLLLIRVIK